MSVTDTIWQIAVQPLSTEHDAQGRSMLAQVRRAGFAQVSGVRSTRLYQILGKLDRPTTESLAQGLFADPVTERWECTATIRWPEAPTPMVEVHLQPGVMDPVALSSLGGIRDLLACSEHAGTAEATEVRTAWRYEITGVKSTAQLDELATRVLANTCIERVFICGFERRDPLPTRFPISGTRPFDRRTVALHGLTHVDEKLSRDARTRSSAAEMRAIREHFAGLDRDPTDLELETLAQTWSEHCVHKTLKSAVIYHGRGFGPEAKPEATITRSYENLLSDTVARATRELNRPWCLSVFEDNAGIIEFNENHGIAFKVETHNHPSAIEPYGGAATGVGGCIRDVLGCGLGAKPIANTDYFCLADPNFNADRLPPGVLHPRRILRGIVSGVRDYGNRMGIPTVAGGLYFDDRYLANPLVYCGCLGIIPRNRIDKEPRPGDKIVVVGGRTGRDGLGGATFSSAELTDTHADEFAHAVQIGNAIEEKKVLDALLRARDHERGCLYSAITDCGAGGLSSAVGEMGRHLGATVELQHVPLKYAGLRYNEIWLSEAQERMVLAVNPENLQALLAIFAQEEVETAVIGEFTSDAVLRIHYDSAVVGELDCHFLHEGLPKHQRTARWDGPPSDHPTGDLQSKANDLDPAQALIARLQSLNVCSREPVFRQYDHEVQGGSAVKPAVGIGEGPSDAAVIRPLLGSHRGIAIGCGLCPHIGDDDPYWMAVMAIDEAVRNVICVGADPERIAILDNFCWGGCRQEREMGALVRACQGCYDAAIAYGVPFISGKDSLNNQFSLAPQEAERLNLPTTITIPDTLLISAVGIVHDVRQCVTSDLKRPGRRIVYVSRDIRSGSLTESFAYHQAISGLVRDGSVAACHDVSDGGLAVCIAEMCIGGARGAMINLDAWPGEWAPNALLFDESRSGYVLELSDDPDLSRLEELAEVVELGRVSDSDRLQVTREAVHLIDVTVAELSRAWRAGFNGDSGETADG